MGIIDKLKDAEKVKGQLRIEAEFLFQLFPLNLLGADIVPRLARYAGYRAFGMRIETPNVFGGLIVSGNPRLITIGEDSFLNRGVILESVGPITLGRGVQVGPQAAFITSHHPRSADGDVSTEAVGLPIVVGDRCWIGARAMILPGVTLAEGVTVAAGSVVTRDCDEPGGVYAGVPAKLVKQPSPEYRAARAGRSTGTEAAG